MTTLSSVTAAVTTHASAAAHPHHVRASYLVSGLADAQFLSRVLEPVAKLGLVPDRLLALRDGGNAADMTVDLRLAGVSARHAELVEFALRAIVGVSQVVARIDRPN